MPEPKPTTLYRDMDVRFDRAAYDTRAKGEDRIPIAFSSETPVEREDPWTGKRFYEVLDHSSEGIDLSYARDGLPLLLNHDTRDQNGIVEDIARGPDGMLRGMARFSRSQRGQELKQDFVDGIRKKLSVGYRTIGEGTQDGTRDGVPVLRFRFMPLEVSSVPIPADYAVGVGRSAGGAAPSLPTPPAQTARKAEEIVMPDNGTATTGTGDGAVVDFTNTRSESSGAGAVVRVVSEQGNPWAEIGQLAEMHAMQDKVSRWMADGQSPAEVRRSMNLEIRERIERGPIVKPRIELNEKEQRQYSMARAILSSAEGSSGFERDISEQIAKNLPSGYRQNATTGTPFYIPTNITTRTGLDSKTSTMGTELKFIQAGSFVDMLRNKARVLQLGATMLSGLDSPVTFPVQNGAGTATWVAENPGSDVSDSNLTLTTRTLSAKTLQSTTSFSRQLLRQAVFDVETLVRNDLAQIHALALDLAAIAGTGASNQPTGILTNTSVGVYAIGTNGGAPTYQTALGLEFTVENANANVGPMGYLTTPGVKATYKNTAQLTNTAGVPVWLGGEEGEMNGYRAFSSKQVPSNLTKGTSTTICSAIIFGVWSQLYIGEWGALEVITDPYRLKKQGMIEVTSFQMADIMLRYPEAFAVTKDALSAF